MKPAGHGFLRPGLDVTGCKARPQETQAFRLQGIKRVSEKSGTWREEAAPLAPALGKEMIKPYIAVPKEGTEKTMNESIHPSFSHIKEQKIQYLPEMVL